MMRARALVGVRRVVRGASILAATFFVACAPAPPDAARTDVLWVTLCTTRADHLGFHGYDQPTTPWLDALARGGVVFDHLIAAAPWTRPSIAALSTGVHPRALGIVGPAESLQLALPAEAHTVAERLREAGYATLAVVANPNVDGAFGFAQGFDVYQTHDVAFSHMRPGQKLTAEAASAALLEEVGGLPAERRFFAQLVLVDAHRPYDPKPAAARLGGLRFEGPTADYDLQIRYMDDVLREFVAALRSAGREDLLIVVTADHGEGFEERPGDRGHGFSLWNNTLRVPWILAHPSFAPARIDAIAESVDVPRTLLDLLGVDAEGMVDARSFADAVRGGALPERSAAVSETELLGARLGAWLEEGWKLVVDRTDGAAAPQLYRYRDDPEERDDRAPDEAERVARMAAALEEWRLAHDRRAPAERVLVEPPPGMRARLEALGYLVP